MRIFLKVHFVTKFDILNTKVREEKGTTFLSKVADDLRRETSESWARLAGGQYRMFSIETLIPSAPPRAQGACDPLVSVWARNAVYFACAGSRKARKVSRISPYVLYVSVRAAPQHDAATTRSSARRDAQQAPLRALNSRLWPRLVKSKGARLWTWKWKIKDEESNVSPTTRDFVLRGHCVSRGEPKWNREVIGGDGTRGRARVRWINGRSICYSAYILHYVAGLFRYNEFSASAPRLRDVTRHSFP